ncbi:hypothetical protein [Flexibacterium corallicola]|uniref:hypothetical protein n=1 Tax=Flexibacterium corallicola TaxID=3037259 RepID=UPI00286F8E6F|nr:hypothetical protein [Pseudovibrio sp. M1P-2-3]
MSAMEQDLLSAILEHLEFRAEIGQPLCEQNAGFYAVKNKQLVSRLKNGKTVTLQTYNRALAWIDTDKKKLRNARK